MAFDGLPFAELVHNAVQQSQAFMDGVNANVETALEDLFASIDLNKDGVISKDEFTGMSLNTWAMLRSLTSCVNCLPKLPSMKALFHEIPDFTFEKLQEHFPTVVLRVPDMLENTSWFTIYIGALIGFQLFLYLLENWRYLAGLRCTWRFQEIDRPVIKVDKATALSYDTPLTTYEKIKMVFMTLSGIVLFRFVMTVFCFMLSAICVNIATLSSSRPWHVFWMWWCRFWSFAMLHSMGYMRINVSGKIADRSKVKILVGNHCCMIEVTLLYILSGGCAFVSAVENLHIPLFRGICEASDALLVDRTGKESRKQTIEEIKRRAQNSNGSQMMMFPEGTLNNQRALFSFKTGPFIPGVPVQPVCFRVPYTHFNPCWTGEAVGGPNLTDLCWRTLSQFVNRCEVKILPVYIPSEEEKNDPVLYGNNVRDLMAKTLDLPVSDASFDDYKECQTIYTEELKKLKNDTGYFNFARAKTEMRSHGIATRDMLKTKVGDFKEGGLRMSLGPLAFQKAHPEGLLSNYENSEGGYITSDGVKKLAQYKFQSGGYSTLDNLMNPFWIACAALLPRWISPNMVTFTGFSGFCFALFLILYDANASGNSEMVVSGSPLVQLSVAFLMWFYQTMDCMDGKHARATNQATPLGALFDHGCDALAMVLGAICLEVSLAHPHDRATNSRIIHLLAFTAPLSAFYFAQWEHYHTHVLPTAGITESQLQVLIAVGCIGFIDRLAIHTPLVSFGTEWTFMEVAEVGAMIASAGLILSSVRRVVSKTGSLSPLMTLLPFLLHHVQIVLLSFSPCFESSRILCLCTISLNFADLTLRMIISGLCSIRYPFIHWTTVPFTAVSFWVFFYPTSHGDMWLGSILAWQLLSILWIVSDTIARICSCLNIPFLAPIQKPAEKET